MTLINWILTGLLIIDTGFIVLALIKKWNLLEKICCALFFPLSVAHPPYLLLQYTPDSYHTFFLSVLALLLTTIALLIFIFATNKTVKGIGYFVLLVGFLAWGEHFRTIFYIYNMPQWLTILIISVNVIILIAVQIITGRKKVHGYLSTTLFIAGAELLNVFAVINLIYEQSISTILLFAGTFLNLLLVIFDLLDIKKFNIKHGMLVRTISLTASQFLIAFSCLLVFN